MATTYDKASLVMIPSGYKDDKLYSIKPTDGSGDFTFSRDGAGASPATRVNASGLIEKGRENVILQSNQFDTTWVNSNTTETGGQSGYDGSSDAWQLTAASTGSSRIIGQNNTTTGVSTFSVYAKAGNINYLALENGTDFAYISLIDGSVGNSGGTNYIAYSSTDVGGGWWRVSITFNKVASSDLRIYLASSGTSTAVNSGDYIYIQDAQLESGLVATDYIETTTAPVSAGLLGDMPRLDYSGDATCPSLLLEPSRVNYLPHSEYISGGWLNAGGTSSQNSQDSTSPEGVYNAAVLNASSAVYRIINASSNPHTFSVYAKQKDGNNIQLRIDAPTTKTSSFNLANGSVVSEGSGHTASIEDAGNGWYRCIISFTDSIVNAVLQTDASGSVYVYGAQLEDNLYVTSLIPTYGSASTRGAEVGQSDVSSLLTSNEGTLFIHLNDGANSGGYGSGALSIGLQDATSANFVGWASNSPSPTELRAIYKVSGATYYLGSSTAINTESKILVKWGNGSASFFKNGALFNTQSTANFSGQPLIDYLFPNQFRTGNFPIEQTLVFPTALTDAECIALTTI